MWNYVSLWLDARGSRQPWPPTDLSCPPQSPRVAPPLRCSFLISSSSPRRFASARSSSSRQHTAQVPQLPTDSFAHPCVVVAFLYLLRLYVRHCNTTPSPWWLLCLQWSVPPTTRTARAAVRVDRPTSLVSVSCIMPCLCIYVLLTPRPRRSSAERR